MTIQCIDSDDDNLGEMLTVIQIQIDGRREVTDRKNWIAMLGRVGRGGKESMGEACENDGNLFRGQKNKIKLKTKKKKKNEKIGTEVRGAASASA